MWGGVGWGLGWGGVAWSGLEWVEWGGLGWLGSWVGVGAGVSVGGLVRALFVEGFGRTPPHPAPTSHQPTHPCTKIYLADFQKSASYFLGNLC